MNSRSKNRIADENVCAVTWKTPIGALTLESTANGVRRIYLPGEKARAQKKKSRGTSAARLVARHAMRELNEYLRGSRDTFTFKLDLQTTPFRRRALLKGVAEIPYGETRTYGEVARKIGAPRACRAVGGANAANPLPLVIPCHRVVATNGLGGFGGGLALKKKLLAMETVCQSRETSNRRE